MPYDPQFFDDLREESTRRGFSGTALDVIEGFSTGVRRDPFINALMVDGAVGPAEEDYFNSTVGNSTAEQIGMMIGEYGPSLLLGFGAYSKGAQLATKATQTAAKAFLANKTKKQIADLATTQVFKFSTPGASRLNVLQRMGDEAGNVLTGSGNVMKRSLMRVGTQADKTRDILGTPGIERAAQTVGGNLGVSSLVAAQEKARGKTNEEALKTAAVAFVVGVGVDGGLAGLGRIPRKGRSTDLTDIRAGFDRPGPAGVTPRQEFEKVLTGKKGQKGLLPEMDSLQSSMSKIMEMDAQTLSLEDVRDIAQTLDVKPNKIKSLLKKAERREILQSNIDFVETAIKTEGAFDVVDQIITPGSWTSMMNQAGLHMAVSPEALMPRFGEAGNRIFSPLLHGVTMGEHAGRRHEKTVGDWFEKAAELRGFSLRETVHSSKKASSWLEDWHQLELGGLPKYKSWLVQEKGLSPTAADELGNIWNSMSELSDYVLVQRGSTVGSKGGIDLSNPNNVNWYITHSGVDDAPEAIRERLIARGMEPTKAHKVIAENSTDHLGGIQIEGVGGGYAGQVGPIDFDRAMRGLTGKEKIARGLPETMDARKIALTLKEKYDRGLAVNTNPFDATLRVLRGGEMRIHIDPILGTKGEHIPALANVISAGGGDGVLATSVMQALGGRKYYNQAMQDSANFLTGLQVVTKLPLAVIANMSQSQNTVIRDGFRSTWEGFKPLWSKASREEISKVLALNHSVVRAMGRSFDDQGLAFGTMDRLADYTLKFSGFDMVERGNRMLAGSSALLTIKDSVIKHSQGMLRGKTLDQRRRSLRTLNIDLDDAAAKLKIDPNYMDTAAWKEIELAGTVRGAQQTQFFTSRARRPTFWDHPFGRTLFQFKSFALGQTRFIKDGVLAEWSQGNIRPLATLLSISPVAGELVADARSIINDKRRTATGVDRVLDNLSYVGGLGLFSDTLAAARWGNAESLILGPSIGDMATFGEFILQGNTQQLLNEVYKQPLFKAGSGILGVLGGTAEVIGEYVNETSSSVDTVPMTDLATLRLKDKLQR
ncbi:MAG: hypothetical protein GY737_00255 [Desulfobacteraceae bacterium]|nr:hypothetical protein [Desulfobacteraceae bacterium]